MQDLVNQILKSKDDKLRPHQVECVCPCGNKFIGQKTKIAKGWDRFCSKSCARHGDNWRMALRKNERQARYKLIGDLIEAGKIDDAYKELSFMSFEDTGKGFADLTNPTALKK